MTSCAQCGSENEEGSRFCGECGEKLAPAGEVIATPDTVAPAGGTRTAVLPHQRSATPRPSAVFDPDPSLSMPAARRASPILIAVLLLLDAGLATAGALLLKAGLAKSDAVAVVTIDAAAPDAGPAAPDAATAISNDPGDSHATGHGTGHGSGSGTGTGSGSGSGSGTGTGTGTGSASVDDVVSDIFGKHPDARPASTPPPVSPDAAIPVIVRPPDAAPATPPPPPDASSGPVDPYATPDAAPEPSGSGTGTGTGTGSADTDDPRTVDLASEVERKSSQSQSRFTRCYQESAKAYTPDQPLAGEVDIAFRVMPTGEVQNAAAVRNTTGSDKLADCLTAVIAAWTFPPSQLAEAAVFVRPLRFDGH
jgi:hypothetical protein